MTKKPKKQVIRKNFPSVENQFKPGQSGNPKGPPKAKVHLWRHFCTYSNMTDNQFTRLQKRKLTQSQQAAVKLVLDMKQGIYPKSGKFAEYVINREQGKPREHLTVDTADTLSPDECNNIRDILRRNNESN